jgi:chromosome segregation ATPase
MPGAALSKYGALRLELTQRDEKIASLEVLISDLNALLAAMDAERAAGQEIIQAKQAEIEQLNRRLAVLHGVLSADLKTIASLSEQVREMGRAMEPAEDQATGREENRTTRSIEA